MKDKADALVGTVLSAGGAAGLTVQIVTDFASLAVVALNIILALGGLYLLWLRVAKAKRDLKKPRSGAGD